MPCLSLRLTDNQIHIKHVPFLTALCGDLHVRSLGTLLALESLSLTLGGTSSVLGLLGLLLTLSSGPLLLSFLDGGGAGGATGLGALCSTLLDHVERGTDDGTLVLDGAASALLGDLL